LRKGLGNQYKKGEYIPSKSFSVVELVLDLTENIWNEILVRYKPEHDGVEPGLPIISIPIYYSDHWMLCIVLTDSARVIMLDTWKDATYVNRQRFYTSAIPAFIEKFISIEEPEKAWSIKWVDCPFQLTSDCGVFVCVFMYIFAVLYSNDLTKTLSLLRSIDQDFWLNNPIRHQIALSILKSDIGTMNLYSGDNTGWYSKQVNIGRNYTWVNLGLMIEQLHQRITDKKQ
jgi:hypothetical protein